MGFSIDAEISSKADSEKTQTMLSDVFVLSLFWTVILSLLESTSNQGEGVIFGNIAYLSYN